MGWVRSRGMLSGDLTVNGGALNVVNVSGAGGLGLSGSHIRVNNGRLNTIAISGDVENDSLIEVGDRLGSMFVRGDLTDSSVEANSLGRVRVTGQISDPDGNDSISALDANSGFSVGDTDTTRRVNQTNNHVDFDGLDAHVG